jgi:hypothetical protein
MPDYWLDISRHPESPASGQIDQSFPWFSSVLEQMLSWYPNSLPVVPSKFRPTVALQTLHQNFTLMQPFELITIVRSKPPAQFIFHRLHIYSFPESSRFLKHTCARRSGHYLGTFETKEKNMFLPPPPPNVVSLSLPTTSSLSLSLSS